MHNFDMKQFLRRHIRLYWVSAATCCLSLCITFAAALGGIDWWRPCAVITIMLAASSVALWVTKKRGLMLSPRAVIRARRLSKEWRSVANDKEFISYGLSEDRMHQHARRTATSVATRPVRTHRASIKLIAWSVLAASAFTLVIAFATGASSNGHAAPQKVPTSITADQPYNFFAGTK